MRDIAAKTGVATGAAHYQYPSKDAGEIQALPAELRCGPGALVVVNVRKHLAASISSMPNIPAPRVPGSGVDTISIVGNG